MIMEISPNPYSLINILYFFFMFFGVVPFILLTLWFMNPFLMKAILKTFGLSEESLAKEKKASTDRREDELDKEKKQAH